MIFTSMPWNATIGSKTMGHGDVNNFCNFYDIGSNN